MKINFQNSKKEDVHQVVPLIYSSGPAAFDYVFKTKTKSASDFLVFAFLQNEGEFSFKTHTTVFLENKIVGVGASFDCNSSFKFTLAAILQIVQFYRLSAFGVLYRGLQVEKLIKPPQNDEIAIAHLGIDAKYQGLGIGSKLIHFLLKNNRNKKVSKAILDVAVQNPAQKLYQKIGFKITITNKSTLKRKDILVLDHYRMEMKL